VIIRTRQTRIVKRSITFTCLAMSTRLTCICSFAIFYVICMFCKRLNRCGAQVTFIRICTVKSFGALVSTNITPLCQARITLSYAACAHFAVFDVFRTEHAGLISCTCSTVSCDQNLFFEASIWICQSKSLSRLTSFQPKVQSWVRSF
jgi:hypothetical protein